PHVSRPGDIQRRADGDRFAGDLGIVLDGPDDPATEDAAPRGPDGGLGWHLLGGRTHWRSCWTRVVGSASRPPQAAIGRLRDPPPLAGMTPFRAHARRRQRDARWDKHASR